MTQKLTPALLGKLSDPDLARLTHQMVATYLQELAYYRHHQAKAVTLISHGGISGASLALLGPHFAALALAASLPMIGAGHALDKMRDNRRGIDLRARYRALMAKAGLDPDEYLPEKESASLTALGKLVVQSFTNTTVSIPRAFLQRAWKNIVARKTLTAEPEPLTLKEFKDLGRQLSALDKEWTRRHQAYKLRQMLENAGNGRA